MSCPSVVLGKGTRNDRTWGGVSDHVVDCGYRKERASRARANREELAAELPVLSVILRSTLVPRLHG